MTGPPRRRSHLAHLAAVRTVTLSCLPALVLVAVLWGVVPSAGSALALEGPPPTPVPPRGSPSPFIQKLDDAGRTLKPPPLGSRSAILIDLETGQPMFAERPTMRRPIASLTKVMTALLTIEKTDPDEIVEVSDEAAPPKNLVGLSMLGLQEGETISVKQLMYALLLESANDSAVALAEHISGSQTAFEHLMDRRAGQLGMTDSHFESPNGLDDGGYSTAQDLAILTRAAMDEPEFARIVRTKFHTIPPASKGQPPRKIQNRNVLLWLYPGATGVKTGFTTKAGYNVIATATRGGRRLLVVVLGDHGEAFSDAAELLTYGFKGFAPETLVESGERVGTRKVGVTPVELETAQALELLMPKRGQAQVVRHIEIDPDAASQGVPTPGSEVGDLRVTSGGVEIGSVPVVVATSEDGSVAVGGVGVRYAKVLVRLATAAWLEVVGEGVL